MESATAARYAEEKDVVTELLDAVVREKKNPKRNKTFVLQQPPSLLRQAFKGRSTRCCQTKRTEA